MQQQSEEGLKRPQLLAVLLILTFIGSGFSMLANGIMYFTIEEWKAAYEQGVFDVLEDQLQMDALEMMLTVNPLFYLLQAVLFMFSFIGAYMMWNFNKQGFHLYSIAQILLLIIYKLFLTAAPFPLLPLLITISFVLLYYRNLQFMK